MSFYVYQVTNTVNGKNYIGAHIGMTDDTYLGSGVAIRRAIQKYGSTNFIKTILCECVSEQEMYIREREFVTPEFVSRADTYNMTIGGSGGFTHINSQLSKLRGRQNLQLAERNKQHPEWGGARNMAAFRGENNPAKRPEVRIKLRAPKSEEHKHKIGLGNTGKKRPDLAARNRQRALSNRMVAHSVLTQT